MHTDKMVQNEFGFELKLKFDLQKFFAILTDFSDIR